MFSGIVDHEGEVLSVSRTGESVRIEIRTQFNDFEMGESIAVDGTCLTVDKWGEHSFECLMSPETSSLTTCGKFEVGTQVNLERALRLSDRLGGHMVSGHVDGTLRVLDIKPIDDCIEISFGGGGTKSPYLFKKGSAALNGVSLTINSVAPDRFSVMLIPHTLERTNLKKLKTGSEVNVEYDMMARIVVDRLEEINR